MSFSLRTEGQEFVEMVVITAGLHPQQKLGELRRRDFASFKRLPERKGRQNFSKALNYLWHLPV